MSTKEFRREPNEEEKRAAMRVWDLWQAKKQALKITQLEASMSIDMTSTEFNSYVKGRRPIGFKAAKKFSELFGVSVTDLFPELFEDTQVDDAKTLIDSFEVDADSKPIILSILNKLQTFSRSQLLNLDGIISSISEIRDDKSSAGTDRSVVAPEKGDTQCSTELLYLTLSHEEVTRRLVDIMHEKSIFQAPPEGLREKYISPTKTEFIIENEEDFLQYGDNFVDFMDYAENKGLLPKDRLDPLHSELLSSATTLNWDMIKPKASKNKAK